MWILDFGHIAAMATNEIQNQSEQPKTVDQIFDEYCLALKIIFYDFIDDRRDSLNVEC